LTPTKTYTLTRTSTPTRTPTKTATSTYPYGIRSVQTIPDVIQPEKNLHALFDGLTYPNYAIRDFNIGEAVAIIMQFGSGTSLSGFSAGFGGDPNRPDSYSVSVEAANSLADLNAHVGTYRVILTNVPAPGKIININLPFGRIVTARFFKVTVLRNDSDRRVHIYEMRPLFPPQ
jgi:hypothetical protein